MAGGKARRPRRDTLFAVPEIIVVSQILTLAGSIPEQFGIERNRALARLVELEPLFGGAVYSTVVRLANAKWLVGGTRTLLPVCEWLLNRSEFGLGFQALICQLAWGALTSDSGGWAEIIRTPVAGSKCEEVLRVPGPEYRWVLKSDPKVEVDPGDVVYDPDSPPMVVSLNPIRCIPTEDPARPLLYRREDGVDVILSRHEAFQVVDLRLPGTARGWCAASRLASAVNFMSMLLKWHNERLSGTSADTLVLTNAPAGAVEAGLERAAQRSVAAGNRMYVAPVFLNPLDPSVRPEAQIVHLKELPDGFRLKDLIDWYILVIANCLGIDWGSIAPLPGSRLGTATEAEVMARMASTKLYGMILGQIAYAMTAIFPPGTNLRFAAADYVESEAIARAAATRASERATRIQSGEIPPQIARQIAADAGDLAPEYLALLGESDITPPAEMEATDVYSLFTAKARLRERLFTAAARRHSSLVDGGNDGNS